MTKIEELIQQFYPEGVEYKELGEVCKFQRGTSITQKDVTDGDVPVIAGGQKPSYYHNIPNRIGETIAVSGSGAYAGFISYWSIPVFLSDSFSVNPQIDILLPKYVFYFLKNIQEKIHYTKKGSGVPHVHGSSITKFQIPIPPLPIQQEIVSILDKFTQLEAELEAELEARRAQYKYYRDQLLCFEGKEVEWKMLGEVGEFIRGSGMQKSDFTESGVGCIHYGQIYTYYGFSAYKTKTFVSPELAKKLRKAKKGDIVIATTSENIEDVCKTVVWLGDEEIAISGETYIFKHNQNAKFIAYYLKTPPFLAFKKQNITGTKVIRVHGDKLKQFKIPIPPIEEQERIVAILDQFDALVNDISVGLPAEIEARRKQYEYYRKQL